jgi:hypothetical protein
MKMPLTKIIARVLLCSIGMLLAVTGKAAMSETPTNTILRMERAALDRWAHGDPDGFLEISDPDVVYFDPGQPRRLNGIGELRHLYDGLRGKVKIDHYELIDPKVQIDGNMAVLTFNFVSTGSEGEMRWNTTEVYRCHHGTWRIIQTHWSLTQPQLALSSK